MPRLRMAVLDGGSAYAERLWCCARLKVIVPLDVCSVALLAEAASPTPQNAEFSSLDTALLTKPSPPVLLCPSLCPSLPTGSDRHR